MRVTTQLQRHLNVVLAVLVAAALCARVGAQGAHQEIRSRSVPVQVPTTRSAFQPVAPAAWRGRSQASQPSPFRYPARSTARKAQVDAVAILSQRLAQRRQEQQAAARQAARQRQQLLTLEPAVSSGVTQGPVTPAARQPTREDRKQHQHQKQQLHEQVDILHPQAETRPPPPPRAMDAAAAAAPPPVDLPGLSETERQLLARGQPVLRQTRQGGWGQGLFVADVEAEAGTILDVLQRYADYEEMIHTVRGVRLLGERGPSTHAEFVVSKFRLPVRVLLTARPAARTVDFHLDPAASSGRGALFKEARGTWHVQPAPGGRAGASRVWLVASLTAHRAVPGFMVDHFAAKALPRATSWLKPVCERVQAECETAAAAAAGGGAGAEVEEDALAAVE